MVKVGKRNAEHHVEEAHKFTGAGPFGGSSKVQYKSKIKIFCLTLALILIHGLSLAYGMERCSEWLGLAQSNAHAIEASNQHGASHPGEVSIASISVLEGFINLWSTLSSNPTGQVQLKLDPNNPAVIGRLEGGRPPYLARGYQATHMLPNGAPVLRGTRADETVSRAHFMLKHHAQGILLINGVPGRDGALRAPLNGTYLLSPENRNMVPGEAFLIERGSTAKIRLPNNTLILISAE